MLLFGALARGVAVDDVVEVVFMSPDDAVERGLDVGMSLLLLTRYWINRDKILLGAWLW